MVYLVTGGAGFIGGNFVRYKLGLPILDEKPGKNARDKVIVLDAVTYAGNPDNFKEALNDENILVPRKHRVLGDVEFHLDGRVDPLLDPSMELDRWKFKFEGYEINEVEVEELGARVSDVLERYDLVFVVGNIMDKAVVEQLMPLVDYVVNFAAETHVDRSILNPDVFIKTDVYGTYVLLEAARKSSGLKKFLHVSTDEVYGVSTERSFTEEDPINPRNPYSASKAAADRMVNAFYVTYGVPVNIVRPSNNFGPRQYPEKLIPLMTIRALNGEALPVYGDGKQIRDWLYVGDAVKAIDIVLQKAPVGEVYNIAGHNERENIHVVKAILKELGRSEELIKFVKDRPGHDRRYSLNDEKLRASLGFRPDTDFEALLPKVVNWYMNNGDWWEKIIEMDREYRKFMERWYNDGKS